MSSVLLTENGDADTFRYDAGEGQYVFNLSTKNLKQGNWYLRIDQGDGVNRTVQIKLKK